MHHVSKCGKFSLNVHLSGGPNSEESVISGEGDSGKWQDVQYCPDDKLIVGFALKVEESQGSYDDAGALNFAAFCGAQFGARNNKVALEGEKKLEKIKI